MNYFSKLVMIRYACGHKKLGIDTYQSFVTENKVKCPKCCKVSIKDTAEHIFSEWKKAGCKFAIAVKLIGIEIQRSELVKIVTLTQILILGATTL